MATKIPIAVFDVDGTLLNYDGTVNWKLLDLIRLLTNMGWRCIVHSGGGKDYAQHVVRKLHLEGIVDSSEAKGTVEGADLSFDDEIVNYALCNIQISQEEKEVS